MMRLTLCLFVLWIGVTVGTVVDLQKRIIGGQTCGQNERHYHVRLRAFDANRQYYSLCGGSLISDQWILTAAHCWEPGRTMEAELGVHPGPTIETQTIPQSQRVIFMDKDNNNNVREHDIMLLKLPTPTQIRPVGLPDCRNRPSVGVQIAGHASTTTGRYNKRQPGISNTLPCANINIVDCTGYRNMLQQNDPRLYQTYGYQHWFCGQSPTVDICLGDSGGGVVYQGRIYGVIAFTGDGSYACSQPAGFMDICHRPYIEWIKEKIKKRKKCLMCG